MKKIQVLFLFIFISCLLAFINFASCTRINSKFEMSSGSSLNEKSIMRKLLFTNLCGETSKSTITSFLQKINKVKEFSSSKPCSSSKDCRNWREQSLIAFCKVEEFRKKANLPFLEPLYVSFKTLNENEYSGFLFNVNLKNKKAEKDKLLTQGLDGKLILRACISVDRKKTSYVDFKCPFVKCTDYSEVDNCMKVSNSKIQPEKAEVVVRKYEIKAKFK